VEEPLPSHEMYLGRLSIPYITRSGVVDIRFRALNGEEPKYLGLPSAETTLYNVEALFKAKNYVCICEGEMDTITMASATLHPTVGAPGATSWKKFYPRVFEDFDTIIVLADGDDAGMEFGKRIQRSVNNTRILQMPDGEDVNSVFQKHGAQYINDKIKAVLEI
jgi:DNA primase